MYMSRQEAKQILFQWSQNSSYKKFLPFFGTSFVENPPPCPPTKSEKIISPQLLSIHQLIRKIHVSTSLTLFPAFQRWHITEITLALQLNIKEIYTVHTMITMPPNRFAVPMRKKRQKVQNSIQKRTLISTPNKVCNINTIIKTLTVALSKYTKKIGLSPENQIQSCNPKRKTKKNHATVIFYEQFLQAGIGKDYLLLHDFSIWINGQLRVV